ncbi:3-phosphoshikimate 1-carboxyvinyltransferase [Rhodonellum psychrophilum GCM71 = DSM 17998]|uniref:3-phosphoshikimate 1-carboxyvinyltransferase n=2 Tax=Rhodonellum TaxID=336827 RepID=U5C379_9BACT|nr:MULTISPECIES: 3-phosphoshikimate 1-carboxyvinyltransferase [Rhodonellum]ERM84274.1 3-phosphoshikimate 1-carboxyvinyltransferase [Rhodonellum psychrophilum GCM71 = DSM 17998]SDZ43739.1 3-phosphoshikimate 1-carboxyvinyltransferase [Rhodonellum ikkaensis]
MKNIRHEKKSTFSPTRIPLPSSKSESNRVLVIDSLTEGENTISNLAEARDTQTMIRLLTKNPPVFDVLDAGTTMRFLTAYAVITNQYKIITGTPRMCERPIGILVDALRDIGAEIHYMAAEGFPPLAVHGLAGQKTEKISIRGDVSSQYISAMLMIAPMLPKGLEIELLGKIGSISYIQMTLQLMAQFGVKHVWKENVIKVPHQTYSPTQFSVESDWSGASYWFSLLACADEGELFLQGLKEDSLQGDSKIVEIMDQLGVKSEFQTGGIKLTKQKVKGLKSWDFTNCPDLAQTVAVTCAIIGQKVDFTGLESLRIKETDRILALQQELAKFNAQLLEGENGVFTLIPSIEIPDEVTIKTYDDHRMAMAFLPLVTKTNLIVEDPEVVNKSYPSFWKHVALLYK